MPRPTRATLVSNAANNAEQSPWIFAQPQDDPRVAGYLVPEENCTTLGYEIVLRCYADIGICEQPEGSNMGARIEAMTKRWGLQPPQYWCAIWAMSVWADRGALVVKGGALVENWRKVVKPEWRMTVSNMLNASAEVRKHLIGAMILYENVAERRLAHIGIITRITKNRVFTCEGNRGFAGGVTNNGEWVNIEPTSRHDVYGVVVPTRSPLYAPKRQRLSLALNSSN